MAAQPVDILCPGSVQAAVVATLLVRERIAFASEPLPDGRWRIRAALPATISAILTVQGAIAISADGEEPPVPAAPDVAPKSSAQGEVLIIDAPHEAAAKSAATRIALRDLKITFFGGTRWMAEGEALVRLGYRGGRTGKAVIRPAAGHWTLEWQPSNGE